MHFHHDTIAMGFAIVVMSSLRLNAAYGVIKKSALHKRACVKDEQQLHGMQATISETHRCHSKQSADNNRKNGPVM
jgi:hypothetical protein